MKKTKLSLRVDDNGYWLCVDGHRHRAVILLSEHHGMLGYRSVSMPALEEALARGCVVDNRTKRGVR